MKNVAQRLRWPHGEGVERDNRRPQVACHECGAPTYFDPEHDASPEQAKCAFCYERDEQVRIQDERDEASLEADWRHHLYNDLDGVRW